MTIETSLLTAFVATAGAVLIAVIGLIASVHYRLGKLEEGQKTLAQEDAHTREMVAKGDAQTREMLTQETAHTQELISQTREMLTQEIAHTQELISQTREMVAQGDAQTRELISQTREMAAKGDAQTRDMLTQEIAQTREMAAQENAHTRELLSQLIMQETAAMRERSDAQHAETMSAIQRLTDAFLSHSHDADGTVRFRIPPPATPPPGELPRQEDDES